VKKKKNERSNRRIEKHKGRVKTETITVYDQIWENNNNEKKKRKCNRKENYELILENIKILFYKPKEK
jgi:hypothetical protein